MTAFSDLTAYSDLTSSSECVAYRSGAAEMRARCLSLLDTLTLGKRRTLDGCTNRADRIMLLAEINTLAERADALRSLPLVPAGELSCHERASARRPATEGDAHV